MKVGVVELKTYHFNLSTTNLLPNQPIYKWYVLL